MKITRAALLGAAALAATAAAGLATPPATRAQEGQGAVTGADVPSTQDQPGVVRPKPDLHGRSGGGEAEAHGNDASSPSTAAAPNSPCETDAPAAAAAASGQQGAQAQATAEDCPPK